MTPENHAPMSSPETRGLRPLNIGEMLDRAFSIVFKNVGVFAAIAAPFVVPASIAAYEATRPLLAYFVLHGASASASTSDPAELFAAYAAGGPFWAAIFLLGLFVGPLTHAAIVSGVSRAYQGTPIGFRECMRDAFARWGALIGLAVIWLIIAFCGLAVFVVGFTLMAGAVAGVAAAIGPYAAIIAIVPLLAIVIAAIVAALLCGLAYGLSIVEMMLERLGPSDAFRAGFARVFGGGRIWRSLGIAASISGVVIGIDLIADLMGFGTIALSHSPALQNAVMAVAGGFTDVFAYAVVTLARDEIGIRLVGLRSTT